MVITLQSTAGDAFSGRRLARGQDARARRPCPEHIPICYLGWVHFDPRID